MCKCKVLQIANFLILWILFRGLFNSLAAAEGETTRTGEMEQEEEVKWNENTEKKIKKQCFWSHF